MSNWKVHEVRLPGIYFRMLLQTGRGAHEFFNYVEKHERMPFWAFIEGHVELSFIVNGVAQLRNLKSQVFREWGAYYYAEEEARSNNYLHLYHMAMELKKEHMGAFSLQELQELADRDDEGGKAIENWLVSLARMKLMRSRLADEIEEMLGGDE